MSDISNHRMIRTLILKEILSTVFEKHKIFEERDVAATLFIYWRYLCRLAKVSFKLV